MSRSLIIAVLAGALSGLVFIATMYPSVLAMLFMYFTPLPLFLAGLGLGATAIGVAALTGTVIVGAAKGVGPLLLFFAYVALPAAFMVRQGLLWKTADDGSVAWYPPGRLLGLMSCYGALMFALIYMIMGGSGPGMLENMRTILDSIFMNLAPAMPEDDRLLAAGLWAPYIPAAVVTSWMITLVIDAALAQNLLKRTGRNIRPSLDFSLTELPLAFAFALVACGALWYFTHGVSQFFGLTLTIIIALAYLFVGLAVMHRLTRNWPNRPVVLSLFYLMLLFFLGWPGLVLVAGMGLADQLFGLRARFAPAAQDEEDE